MDLLSLFQSLENSALGTVVRESLWMFPVIECFHLLALSLLGGAVLLVDLRILGWGLTSQPIPDLATKAHPWLAGSLALLYATGIPMFLSEAIKCYYSPPFWYKMGLLLVATIFALTFRRRALARITTEQPARWLALCSLLLWLSVGFSGRWIAFY